MNKRIKTETAVKPVRVLRGAIKKKPTTPKTRNSKKKCARRSRGASDSDDDFQLKTVKYARKNIPTSTIAYPPMEITPRRYTQPRVYEISDTSEDEATHELNEIINISDNLPVNVSDVIHLDELPCSSTSTCVIELDSIDRIPQVGSSSLSTNMSSNGGKNDNILDFIDNLIQTNTDNDILKSMKELNEETAKLLERSEELISNSTDVINFDNSVEYVCTSKDLMKPVNTEKKTKSDNTNKAFNLQSGQEKQIKPQCPICLENLGDVPVSATVCGHTFCTPCIQNCVKTLRKCPTCRKSLTQKMIHPLFLF